MLDEEDQTDKGPPHDVAVEAFLRRELKYASSRVERGKVVRVSTIKELQAIVWTAKRTHTEAFEEYTNKWKNAVRTMYKKQLPPPAKRCEAMLAAVRPMVGIWGASL